jgi:hypothetical protein
VAPITLTNVTASDNGQYGVLFYPSSNIISSANVVSQSTIANNGSAGVMIRSYQAPDSLVLVKIVGTLLNGNGMPLPQNVIKYGDIAAYGKTTYLYVSKSTFELPCAGNGAGISTNIFSYGDNMLLFPENFTFGVVGLK